MEIVAVANESYHEPTAELTDETRDMHRTISFLMEELKVDDWYYHPFDASKDKKLFSFIIETKKKNMQRWCSSE